MMYGKEWMEYEFYPKIARKSKKSAIYMLSMGLKAAKVALLMSKRSGKSSKYQRITQLIL